MGDRLFVYGLLREGETYGHVLEGCPRTGPHALAGFALYDLGRYPGAVRAPATIVGDLCEIASASLLPILDEIEGVHAEPPLYTRERVVVAGAPAWIYVYDRPLGDAPRIASGDWLRRKH